MIGVDIPVEAQRAVGYAALGGFVLKALDLLVKWRSGQRHDTLSELKEAVQQSREIRMDIRAELEETRIELAASELRAEEWEQKALRCEHRAESAERSLAETVAELRTVRAVTTDANARTDAEDARHRNATKDERERR